MDRGAIREPVPDGGRPGWIAVLTLWSDNLIWVIVTKGLGIMLPTLQDQLDSQTWIIGWITSTVVAVGGLTGPFAGLLSRRFKTGYIIMTCGAMVGVSAIAGSFITTPLQLALLYTLLAGTAFGVTNVLTKEAVGLCFTKNYATANGIARTGYSIGLVVFAPLVQLFMNTYGWRGTMLLVGGISLHLVACGALMATADIPRPTALNDYQSLPRDENSSSDHDQTNRLGTWWKRAFKDFNLQLLLNARYWSIAIMSCCSSFAYVMWIVYFVSQAESNGFSPMEAGTFVTIAGVGNIVAKMSQGFLTDRGVISSWSLTAIFVVVGSASYCVSPLLTSYWALMTSAFLNLFCDGVLSCQYDVIIKDVLGVELLGGAFAWMGLTGSAITFAFGFLPGWLYDMTGSYIPGFLLIGGVQAVALIPLLILPYIKRP